ncbi:MAG: hypothetical protein K2K06_03580 [Oscillospiraceae bacterium]|nr:hypothetical protein [Oscillospiraceae bacterium]
MINNKIIDSLMKGDQDFFTTLDTSTEEGKKQLSVFSSNKSYKKISDYIGKQITFNAVYMKKIEIKGSVAIQTAIQTPNGEIFKSTSEGIAKSVLVAIDYFGYPDKWEEEIWFEIREVNTRQNRNYFKLQLVD